MKNLLPIGLLIGLVVIFFWKIITMSEFFFDGDLTYLHYPSVLFYSENIKDFHLPLWLPYIQCGFPVFAGIYNAFLYPINLLLFFSLPVAIACNLNYVIHFILAGVFTYFYAKVIGLPRFPALISGIIFMFSGFMVARLTHVGLIQSAIWLPLLLIFMEKILIEPKNYFYCVLAGIFIGIQILAGHPQITVYSLLCISLYFFFGVLAKQRHKFLNFSGIFILIMLLGLGISAIQIIPFYELLSLSDHGKGVDINYANVCNYPVKNFINFILPYFWKEHIIESAYLEVYGYVGIFTLFLLLFGILQRNRYIYFFSFLLILSTIMMVGSVTPLYTMLWHLPVFNAMRAPARFLYLLTFSVSIIAGFGISNLIKFNYNKKVVSNVLSGAFLLILICGGIISLIGIDKLLPQEFPLARLNSIQQDVYLLFAFLCFSIILLILWTKQKLGAISFKFLVLSLIIIDLFLSGMRAFPHTVRISKFPAILIPQTAKFLWQDKDIYRVMSVYPGGVLISYKDKSPETALIKLLSPNYNIAAHIPHMNLVLGLVCLSSWNEVLEILRKGTPVWIKQDEVEPLIIKNGQLLNLFNVKYILFTMDIDDNRFPTVFEDNGVKIIENKQILPRAFVVHNFKVIKEKEKVLEELGGKEFNPVQYVILEEDPQVNINSNSTTPSTAKIINYGNEEIIIHCSMKDNGFLILTDNYYPGWQVYIDNKKGEIYRAYHTFRGVYLEKGTHLVKFRYEPLSFKIGLCISLLTLLGIAIFFLYRRWLHKNT